MPLILPKGAIEMANRTRPIRIPIDVSPDELEVIHANMERAGITNRSSYCRKMLIDGCILNIDYTAIKELTAAVGRFGNNVNQIARRANETHRVTETDINEVKRGQEELNRAVRELLSKLV